MLKDCFHLGATVVVLRHFITYSHQWQSCFLYQTTRQRPNVKLDTLSNYIVKRATRFVKKLLTKCVMLKMQFSLQTMKTIYKDCFTNLCWPVRNTTWNIKPKKNETLTFIKEPLRCKLELEAKKTRRAVFIAVAWV